MNFYLAALGCKLNQAEVEALARKAEALGHCVVAGPENADWAILNTCTVTHIADRKSRQLIRQLHRLNPNLRLAVTGCYAQVSADEARAIEGVHLVVGNADKERIIERILAFAAPASVPSIPVASSGLAGSLGHTRAFVKIQDGCDNHCTYCIVAIARGPQRSRAPSEVLAEVRARLSEGYREVVLTGVHIGAYGRDSAPGAPLPPQAGWSLARLVRTILDETPVPRLRLSSVEPWDLSSELLDLWPNPGLCRHLHLPLQSGCDDTLRRMGRRYTTERFEQFLTTIRQRTPEISITTDVIVGFPGESEAEFEASLAFIEKMRFARLHVFRYSPRPGTPAANRTSSSLPHSRPEARLDPMSDSIPPPVAQMRSEALIALGRRMSLDFHRRFVGATVQVLCESAKVVCGGLLWSGLTDNYLRVSAPAQGNLANTLVTMRCDDADETGLRGEVLSTPPIV